MTTRKQLECLDCSSSFNRRSFIKTVGGAALVGAAAPLMLGGRIVQGAPTAESAAETAAAQFFNSLSDDQRQRIVFPFDHELRQKISANWHITDLSIRDDFYSDDQRRMIDEILRGVTSEEGYEKLQQQMDYDAGGVGEFSVACFGSPDSGKFEWELTGRHLTLRVDGNSVDKAAFGGPIVYGHGEEDPASNLYHYQTQKVNEVFKALDATQADKALVKNAPKESAVQLQGGEGSFPGIAIGELSSDQQQLVEGTLKTLLAVYRQEDVDEVMEILKAAGGLDPVHLAFYQQGDIGNDQEWDIWRVEGPSFVWHFRGAPHVHAYINIGMKS
ncbi:MAG: DUF3500 domain-containing protein [Planctomycetota bacterium]|nr:DUF3500 domain-containing protein [Planctomycetota bacterium]MDA1214077.1 DUF3500 domain-containing protein [Planctomycetota bacterium]